MCCYLLMLQLSKAEKEQLKSSKQALLSPLSQLLWADGLAADGSWWSVEETEASWTFSVMKTELKSSVTAVQFLALGLGENWAETLALGVIWVKLCFDLKLMWADLSAVRSHEENSFSSNEGPGEVNEEQAPLITSKICCSLTGKWPNMLKELEILFNFCCFF